jgi:predicted phosphodiesterase
MLIRYLSDLHLELIRPDKLLKLIIQIIPNKEQVCVLAGDIGNPYSKNYDLFMKHINYSFKKTFVITGNHEYYNNDKTIEETNIFITDYFKKYSNISFLNNSYEYYNDYCFVGSTLWSNVSKPEFEINDTYSIKNLDIIKYNTLNQQSISFLEDNIINNNKMIIITHHLPSNSLIDVKYKTPRMLPYNQWFYSDMDTFIEKNKDKIKCWIYGHTHMPSFTKIHDIPFMCNPIGYVNENISSDYNKTYEI